jgi:hypothetical protein
MVHNFPSFLNTIQKYIKYKNNHRYSILLIRIFAVLIGLLTGRAVINSWAVNAKTHN